jgi:predicted TIM-barrel fold metal-dependent hydrolase
MPYLTQPPDPAPKQPRLRCPPDAWDCQVHLFGPLQQYPQDPASPYVSAPATAEMNIALQDALGLARSIVVSGGGYGRDYSYMEHALEKYPARFIGVILPPDSIADAELSRLHKLGVRGVRFVSDGHAKNLPRILPRVARQAMDLGWPVHFYPKGEDLVQYEQALLALPNQIVLNHFAAVPAAGGVNQPAFQALLRMLDTGRVWVKLSGPMRCVPGDLPYAAVTPLARALIARAPQRMLWGSDWPHVNMNGRRMPNDGDLLDLLLDWAPDAQDRRRILADNPAALYGTPAALAGGGT